MLATGAFQHAVTDGPLLVAAGVAALVGLIGFLSPCVLPLVPGYLSYVAGLSGSGNAEVEHGQRRMVSGALLFVLGFTAIFVAEGVLFGSLGAAIRDHALAIERVLGIVTILMGVVFLGGFGFLQREVRIHRLPRAGLVGAPLLGAAFGLAWAPCLTPTFSAVYSLAFQQATAGRGAFLMLCYCLGLGIPFVLVALGIGWVSGAFGFRPSARPGGQPGRRGAAHRHRGAAGHRCLEPLDGRAAHHGRAGRGHRGRAVNRVVRPARMAWRRLTSMRTALILLFLLAVAAVPGSLLPQRPLNPDKTTSYLATHGGWGRFLDRIGMFDVFGSVWFAAIYLLLFISLVGCLIPRIRLHARAVARKPLPAPRNLGRLPESDRFETADPPAAYATAARRALGRRWRIVQREEPSGALTLSAEKGYSRETGNLLFHVALLASLVLIAVGRLYSYQGQRIVIQGAGNGFCNTVSQYDSWKPGRLAAEGKISPAPFCVDAMTSFTATYTATGEPSKFAADVTYRRTRTSAAGAQDDHGQPSAAPRG